MLKVNVRGPNIESLAMLGLFRQSKVNEVTRAALRSAGPTVVRAIKLVAPRETNTMAVAAGSKLKTYTHGVALILGIRRGQARDVTPKNRWSKKPITRNPSRVLAVVHAGARPHAITIVRRGKSITIQHPGTQPQPFVYTAASSMNATVQSITTRRIEERVNAVLQKGGKIF